MRKNKLILNVALSIILSLLVITLIGAYLSWDIKWITKVGEWPMIDRMTLGIALVGTISIFFAALITFDGRY